MNTNISHARIHGLDVLRCLSMFYVVILHVLAQGKGGSLDVSFLGASNYAPSWLLNFGALCAVNCFTLISGYVGINSTYRFSKFIALWFQVLFYTLTIAVLFQIFLPGSVNIKTWLTAISGNQYWYFTAYAVLFCFIPYLNKGIQALSRNQARQLCCLIIIIFGGLAPIFGVAEICNQGYNAIWLACLYVIGACIAKFNLWDSLKKPSLYYGLTVIVTTAIFIVWNYAAFATDIYGGYSHLLVQYTSPLIVLSSIFLFLGCLRLQIKNTIIIKLLAFFAPLSFAVYLIHTNPLIWRHWMAGRFEIFQSLPWYGMMLAVLAGSLAIYLSCSLIDYIRSLLFRLLNISSLSQKLEQILIDIKNKLIHFIP